MISVQMGEHHAIEAVCREAVPRELGEERLLGCDLEPGSRHASGDAWTAASIDEDALAARVDDPRPHRERLRKARVTPEARDQPERPAVRRAAFEERRLELEGSGG